MSFCPFFSNGFTPLLSKTQVINNLKAFVKFTFFILKENKYCTT